MNERKINFKNKKILIYGFGKSGISCFNFLKSDNFCTILDDNTKNIPVKFRNILINSGKLFEFKTQHQIKEEREKGNLNIL